MKYLAVLLVGVLVFGAAKYLDSGPRQKAVDSQSEAVVTAAAETTVSAAQIQETAEPVQIRPAQKETEAVSETEEGRYLLTFVGNCTFGSLEYHAQAESGFQRTVGEEYTFPFQNVREYFAEDEVSFVNLEGVLTDEGYAIQVDRALRGPASYVNILAENSVDAVSLANDHTRDYGQRGYDATISALEAADISYVERDNSTVITTENGLKIGIYGAMFYKIDAKDVTAAVQDLREQADIVIFAPHWGNEYAVESTREQLELAHAAIDAGADIVWGSHPRFLQPMEEYNGGKIFYSLGNFCYGGNIYPSDYDSVLIQQEILRAEDGTVSLGETIVVPVCISSVVGQNNFQPTPYEEGSEGYVRVMEKLALTEKN